ncbi:FAD/NAD(P)-binding domain-containing protein [Serendipita vermifera]|nr:FAD/NAD(P)-binding domain-containing protein [Serendipita vermifera]
MKVAVVGSGCSGLAATWALNEYSPDEVHLFEADSRLGGHAHSVKFVNPNDQKEGTMIDTAFMVYNPSCYPNFARLLKLLNVESIESDMSFSLSRNNGQFEWASSSLRALFCQPHNIFNLRIWRMLWDILRFNACARRFIVECEKLAEGSEMTIDEYLQQNGYSDTFRDNYLMPMTAAIWSTPPEVCATSYTAQSLLRYMHNHHLLRIFRKPSWLTIKGGSHNYVEKIANKLPPSHLYLSTRIKAVAPISVNGKIKIALEDSTRKIDHYDHVILACHANTSLAVLEAGGMITPQERSTLGMFSWTQNEMVVHSDISAMPQNRDAWVAWNYLTESSRPGEKSNSDKNSVGIHV